MAKDNEVREFAQYYYDLGLNVTCITNIVNPFNANSKRQKCPSHSMKELFENRQTTDELSNYDWTRATGLGTVTGSNFSVFGRDDFKLIVMDFDGINMREIQNVLYLLDLPKNYEWVVRSGSQIGFHIYLLLSKYCPIYRVATKYKRNALGYEITQLGEPRVYFDKLEILINTHVVLPPSLHSSTFKYEFINCDLPVTLPSVVREELFLGFVDECCNSNLVPVSSEVYFPAPVTLAPDPANVSRYSGTKYIVIDIETDGLVLDNEYPNILQIAWYNLNEKLTIIQKECYSIESGNLKANKALEINKLNINTLNVIGHSIEEVLKKLAVTLRYCEIGVCYNKEFDLKILNFYLIKYGFEVKFNIEQSYCVMKKFTSEKQLACDISLENAYNSRFSGNRLFINVNGHNAEIDV